MNLQIINGPNLNYLENRYPSIYGNVSFDNFLIQLKKNNNTFDIQYYQSNIEGEIIDYLQKVDSSLDSYQGIVLNAGAYSHTSIAIRDAIESIKIPVVEVHISNIAARESFRQHSVISEVCKGVIFGFGLYSYTLALHYFTEN